MNIFEKLDELIASFMPEKLLQEGFVRVNGPDIGLDIRVGTVFLDLNNESIVSIGNVDIRGLDYYGGFEYIGDQHSTRIRSGKKIISIYSPDSERVQKCFEHYKNVHMKDLKEEEELAENS